MNQLMKDNFKSSAAQTDLSWMKILYNAVSLLVMFSIIFAIGFYGWMDLTIPAYDVVRETSDPLRYLSAIIWLLFCGGMTTAFIVTPVIFVLMGLVAFLDLLLEKINLRSAAISAVNLDFAVFAKLIFAAIFLCCLFKMPYNYYKFVRLAGMFGFIGLCILEVEKKPYDILYFLSDGFIIFWLLSAILINPILLIPLGRTVWNVIDVIWALALVLSMAIDVVNNIGKLDSDSQQSLEVKERI